MDRRGFLVAAAAALGVGVAARPAQAHHKPGHHHGPAPTTTSSSSTTTTTMPATTTSSTTTTLPAPTTTTEPMPTTTVTMGTGARLAWSPPPGWESFQTQAVPTSGGTINLTAGQDYRLIMPATYVNKRVRVVGGRHVVIIGGEVNIDTDWGGNGDDNNALWFDSQTGVIHVEGVWMHGAFCNDGVKGVAGSAVWQVQGCRIDELQGTQAGYHCDGFQPFGGFQALRVDKVTVYSQFQGLMMKADANRWLTTDLRRVNFGQYATPDATARTFNFITGGPNPDGFPWIEGPVHLGQECYLQPRTTALSSSIAPAAWFTFSGTGGNELATPDPAGWASSNPGLVMDGVIKEGLPPGGDYVPVPASGGNVGIGYVSPGYLS